MTAEAQNSNLPVPIQDIREKLPALLEKHIPSLQRGSEACDAALDEITGCNTAEEYEQHMATLADVREGYEKLKKKRMELTGMVDAFKDIMMEYERPFNHDTKAPSKYNEKKKFLIDFNQREHDRLQKEKAEAAKKKDVENHKVDLRAKMLENLSNMVVARVKHADNGSKDYFAVSTLTNFDERAEALKKMKIKLKQEDYDACFVTTYNKELLNLTEVQEFITSIKQEETYDKWNSAVQESASPIVNEWRARIPELKKQLQDVAELEAKNKEAAEELKQKQKDEAEAQSKQRQEQLDLALSNQKESIQEEANMNKMSNEFVAQAATKGIGDPGKTKLVMKFTDPKLAPKAFMEIQYHCMSHPDFISSYPCFQRRDTKKKLMSDDKGRPVYIEAVQWWIDWFLNNCDAAITGTMISEDAKITVKR